MAQANVEVKVQSQDLDKLKGQLVELQRGLKIQYDIDGKPIDLVIDKSLNLQKQVRLLTAELRKTKEGTAEFTLLSNKLDDAKENLERVNAKSKDLFASLSLLPGPVGDFFGKMNGAIGLMKTFTSFSLKDVSDQFKRVVGDIKDVFENLGVLKKSTDDLEQSNANLNQTSKESSSNNIQQTASANAAAAALQNQSKQVQLVSLTYNQQGQAVLRNTKPIKDMTEAERSLYAQQRAQIISSGVLKQRNMELAGSYEKSLAGVVANTAATKVLTLAQRAATFATNALKIALASLGIGAVIFAVSFLVEAIGEWITGAKAAAKENERLTDSYELLKRSIDETQQAIKDQTDLELLRAKKLGQTEEEIYDITLKSIDRRVKATLDGRKKIERELELLTINTKLKEEDRLKLQEDLENKYVELGKQINDLRVEREKAVLTEEVRIAEDGRKKDKENKDKRIQQNKEYLQRLEQDTKTGLDKLRSLEEQNFLSLIEDERDREGVKLSYDKKREEEEINALKFKDTKINGVVVKGEDLRQRLLEQVRIKYGIITINNKRKYDEEDLKRSEEFNDKLRDLLISTYEEGVERDIAEREEKYNRDLREFERDKEFIKKSETEKNEIRKNLRKAADIDIEKIKFDAMIKAYNDELGLLEAQQKTLTEGTQAYLDNAIAIENQAYAIKIANAKGNAKQIEAINIEHEQNLKNIKLSAFEAQKQIDIQRAQSVMTIGTTLQQLAGKNKALATYGVVLEKAGAISQIVSNTQIANAKARSASTITGGQPWVTINNVSAALGIAATIAAAAKSISEIQGVGASANNPQASAGSVRGMARGGYIDGPRHAQGGTIIEAEGGEAIMTRGAVSMFRPILSMMNEAGGGTSFNKNLMVTANDAPLTTKPAEQMAPTIVKTYVVSNELTSEQEKLARLKNLSTL